MSLPHTIGIAEMSPIDPEAFAGHLLRLSLAHRVDRFGGIVSDAFLADYAARAPALGTRLMASTVNGTLRGVAEIRVLNPVLGNEAEVAVTVERDWQNRGMGTALMARTVALAQELAIANLYICCSARNERMQRITKAFGGDLTYDDGTCIGRITVTTKAHALHAAGPFAAAGAVLPPAAASMIGH